MRFEIQPPRKDEPTITKEQVREFANTVVYAQISEATNKFFAEDPSLDLGRIGTWMDTFETHWNQLPANTAINQVGLDNTAVGNRHLLWQTLVPLMNVVHALNDSFRYKPVASVDIREGTHQQKGFTKLAKTKAQGLAAILAKKLASKAGLDVPSSPRKVDNWIKVTVQEFEDGPRVDLEEHKPDGEFPQFTRLRIQGNGGATYGGAWVQVGKSYSAEQLATAFEHSLVNANYAVLYDENDRPDPMPH